MNENRGEAFRSPGEPIGPQGLGRGRNNPYQFNADEMRVLKECNRDSFFQRCLPLSALLGAGTYYGVHSGYFKGNVRYGATPKVVVAVIMGYFIGKFSYQQKCAERLMQLPNSPIGEMLRQKRKGVFKESLEPGLGAGLSLAPFSSVSQGDTYSDVEPRGNVDSDSPRPDYDDMGLDDSHRPSVDNPIYEEEMPPQHKSYTSYEDLRKKNRDEFQQKRSGVTKPLPTPSSPVSPTSGPIHDNDDALRMPIRTNKYGDPLT